MKPFKFEKFWMSKDDIDNMVMGSWCQEAAGSPTHCISRKAWKIKEEPEGVQ